MIGKLVPVLVLAVLIALPLALRERQASASKPAPASSSAETPLKNQTLVIITPHGEPTRAEFTRAFTAWAKAERGVAVTIDWRSPGGTSDIIRYLEDRYRGAFAAKFPQHAASAGFIFGDGVSATAPEAVRTAANAARAAWLASEISSDLDLFFGGGEFVYAKSAQRGLIVDAGLIQAEPTWFTPDIIPATLSGETIYDAKGRYYGACLAVFGIATSVDRLRELGLEQPTRWSDLGDARYFRQLTLADPTKSGAVVTTLERILQSHMLPLAAGKSGDAEKAAQAQGWREGWILIKRLVANARWMTDSASKPTRDTVRGDCAASTAIDYHARSEADWAARESNGRERLRFIIPKQGTSVSADPIALLRGAPARPLAIDFIRFVLSPQGQRLWGIKVGTPQGPERYALRRMPVRLDFYRDSPRDQRSDPDDDPVALSREFTYHGAWTGPLYPLIGPMTKAIAIDPREELQAAWAAIIRAGGPEKVPQAWAEFSWLPVEYAGAKDARNAVGDKDRLAATRVLRRWVEESIVHLNQARVLAEAGR